MCKNHNVGEYELFTGLSAKDLERHEDKEDLKMKRLLDVSGMMRKYRLQFLQMNGDHVMMGS